VKASCSAESDRSTAHAGLADSPPRVLTGGGQLREGAYRWAGGENIA